VSRAGRTAATDFGYEPPIATRPIIALDERGLPKQLEAGQAGWLRFAGSIVITLNGEDVTRRCVGFDTAKGRLTRQRLDGEGRIYVDAATQKVATEILRGKVEVRWR
jgi:hypothetical protein